MTQTVATINGGTALSKYFDSVAIKALHANLFFKDASKVVKSLPKGQNSYVFSRVDTTTPTVAGLTLTEGVTPSEGSFTLTQVPVTLIQVGQHVKFSDVVLTDSAVDLLAEAVDEISRRVADVADAYIQDQIDAGTNIIYAGTATARNDIASGENMTAALLAQSVSKLKNNKAVAFDGGKMMCIAHPYVVHDLKVESGTGTFIDVNKYSKPEAIFNGEIGALFGARIIESANVQFYADAGNGSGGAGNIDVYPTYVFGKNAYGVVMSGEPETKLVMPTATESDPLAQRGTVGVKLRVGAAILRQEALFRIETSSSLAANS